MSIEATMEALTAALGEHTKALNNFVKLGGKAQAGTASTGTTSSGTKPAGDKKPKGPTLKEVQDRFGAYLKVKDKDEIKERVANMAKICKILDTDRVTNADPSEWPKALAMLDKLEAGEDPFEDEDGGGDDDGGDAMI